MIAREVIIVLKDREDEKKSDESKDQSRDDVKGLYDGGWGWCVVAG